MTAVTVSHIRAHLPDLVARVHVPHERVTATADGTASAVLLEPEALEAMEETVATLGDGALTDQLRESEADIAAGRPSRWRKSSSPCGGTAPLRL